MNFLGSTIQVPVPGTRPPDQKCPRCGTAWPAVWFDEPGRRRAEGRFVPRGMADAFWVTAKLDPCEACRPTSTEDQAARDHETTVRRRLEDAHIPSAYHSFRLEPDAMCRQRPGEELGAFMSRAKLERKFGATEDNLRSIRSIMTWLSSNKGRVPRQWLVLYGPPGTGKTATLAAIARKLLSVKPMERVELTEEQLTFRPKTQEQWDAACAVGALHAYVSRAVPKVLYVNATELISLDENRFRNDAHGGDPKGHFVKHQGPLLLDELALVPPGAANSEVKPAEARLFAQLLQPRFDRHRLTVVATNRDLPELIERGKNIFGDAVADRLGAAVHVRLGGPSWR